MAILQATTVNGTLTINNKISYPSGKIEISNDSNTNVYLGKIPSGISSDNIYNVIIGNPTALYSGSRSFMENSVEPSNYYGSLCIGFNSTVGSSSNKVYNSICIGNENTVTSDNSVCIGKGSKTKSAASLSIGYNAGISSSTSSASTNINSNGDPTYKISIGIGGSPLLYYSSANGSAITSDIRDKTEFKEIENAVNFLKKLNPITYLDNNRYNYCENNDINTFNEKEYLLGSKKGSRRHAGFKAQDVYKALLDNYNDNNYADIVDYNNFNNEKNENEFDKYYMRYSSLIPFLVKGIQEQQKQIDELKTEIEKLKSR